MSCALLLIRRVGNSWILILGDLKKKMALKTPGYNGHVEPEWFNHRNRTKYVLVS